MRLPPRISTVVVLSSLVAGLSACPGVEPPEDERPNPFEELSVDASYTLPCLEGEVEVLRTEMGVPHVYAENRSDIACAIGFVTARDRYFQMDLISRFGLGTLSQLLGDLGLENDIEVRSRGGRQIAENMLAAATPEERAAWEAYAAGINAYIELASQSLLPAPEELELVYTLLGAEHPADLMTPWTALNVAGVASTINFVSGFETTDIRLEATATALETWGLNKPKGELRNAGAIADIWNNIVPVYPVASAPDFNDSEARSTSTSPNLRLHHGPRVEAGVLARALDTANKMEQRIGRGPDTEGFGSNQWTVHGDLTSSGNAVLAGDGHLALTSPAFLYQLHLDTKVFGEGDIHTIGLTIPGAPIVGLGHNGSVAWAHTSQVSDINDYYRDVVVLDDEGRPSATVFAGEEIPLQSVDESYVTSAALGSEAGEQTIARWLTGQGRPLFSLEGTEVDSADADPAAVNIFGRWIVAGDVDADGQITAITGAATHYFEQHMIHNVLGWGEASDVDEWGEHLSGMTSYSQHFVAADTSGNILYSGFQAMPCRRYLPRDEEGQPLPGAHPQRLIDGTLYPSFEVRYTEDRLIDAAKDSDTACALTWDEYPHSKNPAQGYLLNSNNAPADFAWDNDLFNDPVYIGGPWYGTWRGSRIDELLLEGAGSHSVESMAAIQADTKSRMATEFLAHLLTALDTAEAHAMDPTIDSTTSSGRMAALWASHSARLEEARGRLTSWDARDLNAASGVETFYNSPDQGDIDDAVATMIWNAYFGRFLGSVWSDEGLPSVFRPTGSYGQTRALKSLLDGVGPNGGELVSIDPETGESVFFDDISTEVTEGSEELMLAALVEALDWLAEEFETEDQAEWLWGLKHTVSFDSFVAREIGSGVPLIASLFSPMNIRPDLLPLTEELLPSGDPRQGLEGFPRPGDSFAVDAAGYLGVSDFSYSSGPVMRMAFELDPAGVTGINILPGGQSSDPDSPHFADQAALWLANEALPVRFALDDVLAGVESREVLSP